MGDYGARVKGKREKEIAASFAFGGLLAMTLRTPCGAGG